MNAYDLSRGMQLRRTSSIIVQWLFQVVHDYLICNNDVFKCLKKKIIMKLKKNERNYSIA
jgi:hypothetical protein